jgi:tetratricopeptide (TPR) repeat protein
VEKEDDHLTLETLTRLLAGTLEHDEMLQRVVPHLLERCEHCRAHVGEIEALKEEFDHWNEEVAVFEGREAPALYARLEGLPFEQQIPRVDELEDFHTWGLCQHLLALSRKAVFEDPGRAADLANLALRVVRHLGDFYHPDWVRDLRARCFAHLGNARRVLGELRGADDAFRKAEDCLARGGTGSAKVRAEIVDLKSSLRRAQRRTDEAVAQAELALSLYREAEDAHGVAKMLFQQAKILEEVGELRKAASMLLQVIAETDATREPWLVAFSQFNLVGVMIHSGELEEAERLLATARPSVIAQGRPLDLVRLRWAEGSIDFGLGRIGPAEAAFREVQREFLERRMGFDAALVSLDLAALYAQEGITESLKRLAVELMPVFEARDVHREAIVALLLFQRACEEERLTAEMARQLAHELRRQRGRSGGGREGD